MPNATYRGAIFRGPGSVDVIDLPYPTCGDDDVIVRNLMAGVCGSDVSAYKHGGDDHMIWQDHEFGHEAVSEIVEMGRNVKGLSLGDHVFVNQGKALRDMKRMATVGSFSEYIRIPQCEVGESVLMIDNDIPVKSAVLVEPFVIGTRGALNLDPGPDKTAIVFGAGIIGLSAAIMLKWFGCPKVMIVDISDFRLANAASFGLVTCNPAKEDLRARAFAEFGSQQTFFGERCQAQLYLDAIGMKVAIDNFAMLAGRGASLAVVGVHHEPVAMDLMAVCYSNWKIKGCGETAIEEALPHILAMMKSGRFDLSALVTHEYRVEQIAEALVMGANAGEAQKVCIAF
ncbi:alcohol dehydrogenase catalytic domain-containing protein [Novosphingobium sp. G106]|uniref:zinc-dependent alcohol dehydrogenase n=1 Tax=Novosphingobium sp. G106 TaxID=2849500 RepID=UPI001C2CD877|nr:alcohol dehydrogenase catalytic domain-containing protein [Novosphingobium sp. G106]MBV1690089.1 alcohol dehydrogenase catalytic domain-containing protein [Novosphingobium sp. G106]